MVLVSPSQHTVRRMHALARVATDSDLAFSPCAPSSGASRPSCSSRLARRTWPLDLMRKGHTRNGHTQKMDPGMGNSIGRKRRAETPPH